MKRVYIIVGSMKPHWLGRRIAHWVRVNAQKQTNAAITIVAAEDINLDGLEAKSTKKKMYDLSEADGYILIAPEYESGKSGMIDNVVAALRQKKSNKPVAFVSYGADGGHSLVERLRTKVKGIDQAPLRNSVHISEPWFVLDQAGELHDEDQQHSLNLLIKQLMGWMAVQPSMA